MAESNTSAFSSSERHEVTSRMLASRIFGLKTFIDRTMGVDEEDEEWELAPGLGVLDGACRR